jgi:IS30 family transposase
VTISKRIRYAVHCITHLMDRNHVGSYDFVEAQTDDGRKHRLMTLIDEFIRECLVIRVARINSFGVNDTMADVMLTKRVPKHIRSDNGAEMTANIVRSWFAKTWRQGCSHQAWQQSDDYEQLRAINN